MPAATKDQPRYATADQLMAQINKKHGPGTMIKASKLPKYTRLTTGALGFDVMLGGGWPTGQWHEIIGEFSSGKTQLCLQTIAANQRLDPNFSTLWIAAEFFDKDWAETCGVDTDRVYLVETRVMEDAYQTVLDFMKNRAVDLVVLDSYPALIPSIEDEKDVEEFSVGRGALVTNKFFRKMGNAIKRSLEEQERPATGLMINQWREKIGVTHGDPRTTPGGKGKDFSFYTRVSLRRAEYIDIDKETVGISIAAVTLKNKSAPARRTAQVDFYYDGIMAGHFDTVKDMAAVAIYMNVVDKGGGGMYYFGDDKWKGLDALAASLREDLDLQAAIRERTLASLGTKSTDPRVTDDKE